MFDKPFSIIQDIQEDRLKQHYYKIYILELVKALEINTPDKFEDQLDALFLKNLSQFDVIGLLENKPYKINGYKIRYNKLFGEFQTSHEVGGKSEDFKSLPEALEFCSKGQFFRPALAGLLLYFFNISFIQTGMLL